MTHRNNEDDAVHFRMERVFAVNDKWFFLTRELTTPVGPFLTREQAERAIKSFTHDIKAGRSVPQAMAHLRIVSDTYVEDDF